MAIIRSELKGILAGMVLGDSHVAQAKTSLNAYMRIQHGLKAAEYLKHKADILRELTELTVGDVGGKYPGVYVRTKNHPIYTRLRELAYPGSKKTVSKTWVNWLTVQGLAIWYMDDGCLQKSYSVNKGGRRRIYRRQIFLNTCSFTLEENQILIELIKERFGITFRVKLFGNYYRLFIGATEANPFIELVRPYIVPCMEYKLDMEYERPQLAVREAPLDEVKSQSEHL